METLGRLFGTPARLKLLRLFFFNNDALFSLADAALRAKVSKDSARREIAVLESAKIIKRRAGKKMSVWKVDKQSPHYEALSAFLRSSTTLSNGGIINTLKRAGTLRLVILSGLFTGAIETKVDLLIVGDRLDERALAQAIQKLEAELGRELRYSSFSTADFRYRRGIYDRLVRDVFDYPRRIILDKIGV